MPHASCSNSSLPLVPVSAAKGFGAVLLGSVLVLSAGCTYAVRGGPPTSLDARTPKERTVQPENEKDGLAQAGQQLLAATDDNGRNETLRAYVMLIDQRYAEFVGNLRKDKTWTDLTTGLAGLALGVAGTLTDAVAAKTNYAAAGTLLAGGAAVMDKSLYYEQTILALVAAMDANRAEARLVLVTGMERPFADYSSAEAYNDLINYERAGTLLGATGYIQTTSKKAESGTNEDIRQIAHLSSDQRAHRKCSTLSLLPKNPDRTLAHLQAAATKIGITIDAADQNDAEKIAAKLRDANRQRESDPEWIYTRFQQAGLITSCP
jgi:hypothetical protein